MIPFTPNLPLAATSPSAPPLAAKAPVGRWMARGVALLCLAASAVTATQDASAQATGIVTTLADFNGATGSAPNQALTLGSDGNYYGVTPSGGPNDQGTFFRLNSDGTISLLYSFGNLGETVSPNSPLLLGTDGNFYGTASAGTGTTATETVYRINTGGFFTVVHNFASNGSEGTQLVPGLAQGTDGNFYGVTQTGGNTTTANTAGDGTIFRLTPGGTLTTIYSFDFNRKGFGGSEPNTPLVLSADGNFYGLTALGGDYGVGSAYQLNISTTPATVTTTHSFNGQEGSTPAGALVEASRGNFYGVTTKGGSGNGVFFNITSNGTYASLHSFTTSELPTSSTSQTANPQSGLSKAADGTFYLTVQTGGSVLDHILQLNTSGLVVTAYKFSTTTDTTTTSQGNTVVGALTQASDGSFYGTTAGGGPSDDGTIFRLVIKPHPSFYDGEVDLSNGVEYLQFPNGNIFGYYAFLSDPRYIYHFDLGYEYVFDAADGKGSVYFYDFKSGHFFFTGPTYPFPYLYDFSLSAYLYYYPDPNNPGRYTNAPRYFYNFKTKAIITQ